MGQGAQLTVAAIIGLLPMLVFCGSQAHPLHMPPVYDDGTASKAADFHSSVDWSQYPDELVPAEPVAARRFDPHPARNCPRSGLLQRSNPNRFVIGPWRLSSLRSSEHRGLHESRQLSLRGELRSSSSTRSPNPCPSWRALFDRHT